MRAKSFARAAAKRLGFEINRVHAPRPVAGLNHLESCLYTLLTQRRVINIVQIGANNGSTNDPIYKFIQENPGKTRIVLIEPQEFLIPYLAANYEFHRAMHILNIAIGGGEELTLYRVKHDCWKDLDVPYAKNWPIYRAPTGITSSDYSHVSSWLSKHYIGTQSIPDLIEPFVVKSMDVRSAIAGIPHFEHIDLLQIDAEGVDGEVIYSSNLEYLQPSLVNWEAGNLSQERLQRLLRHLSSHDYILASVSFDALAIRCTPEQESH